MGALYSAFAVGHVLASHRVTRSPRMMSWRRSHCCCHTAASADMGRRRTSGHFSSRRVIVSRWRLP